MSVMEGEGSEEGSLPSSQHETRGKIEQLGLRMGADGEDAEEDVVPTAPVVRIRGRAVLEDSDDE